MEPTFMTPDDLHFLPQRPFFIKPDKIDYPVFIKPQSKSDADELLFPAV